jgi:hypothetical protein
MIITFLAIINQLFFPNMGEVVINNMHNSSQKIERKSKISRYFKRKLVTKYKPVLDLSKFYKKNEWKGHFSAENFRKNSFDNLYLKKIKKDLRASLISLPKWHTEALKDLEIKKNKHVSRGLSSSSKIILHIDSIQNSEELISVFIHEMGHIVDLGALQGEKGIKTAFYDGEAPVLSDDLSLEFYRLSWIDAGIQKDDILRQDFVSGYAMTDCFEDFAETYLFYRLHGAKFRGILADSPILTKKYEFMKENVFENKEFQLDVLADSEFKYNMIFDATLISFQKEDLKKF